MILVTGCSGFIGFHLCLDLLKKNQNIIGIDSLNSYYSTKLKKKRLNILKKKKNFKFYKINLLQKSKLEKIFNQSKFETIFHLASQPGVIYSFRNPKAYKDNNVKATTILAQLSKKFFVKKIIFTSSSSVYGDQLRFPISEKMKLKPKNYYASTKISCEKILSKIFFKKNQNFLFIVRPFTVYGEFGRPDMLFLKIMKQITNKKKFFVYNNGNYIRDFTYVKDVVKSLIYLNHYNKKKKLIVNICASKPIKVKKFIFEILKLCKIDKSKFSNFINYVPKRKGEMIKTYGSNNLLKKIIKIKKFTSFQTGLKNTFNWYKNFKHKKILYLD